MVTSDNSAVDGDDDEVPAGTSSLPLWLTVVVVIVAVAVGALAQRAVGERVGDWLLPRDTPVDARVVVLAFGAADGFAGRSEVPHLRATRLRDIVTAADDGGARAVGLVDFDSLTFSDGGAGRANVIGSDEMQTLAVAPLLDVALEPSTGRLPFLSGYRFDPLASELAGVGVPIDRSGVVRTVPAGARVDEVGDGVIVETPEYALENADEQSTELLAGFGARLVELGTGTPIDEVTDSTLRAGDLQAPLESGQLRIRWSDGLDNVDDVDVIPVADLIAGDVPASVFADAIVLVGTVDPAKTEFVDTPVGALPELLVHANAVNTLLSGGWLQPAPGWIGWIAALLGASTVAGVGRRRAFVALGAAAALAVGWLVVVRWAAGAGHLLPALLPAVAALTAALGMVALQQIDGYRERRRIRSMFAEYVPPLVAEQLIASGRGELSAAGQRLAVTALFCDLRGFTAVAGRLTPSEVRVLLNRYYELAQVVFDHGGTVLQYTGDEIFGVFGAPLPMDDHAERALACARALHAARARLNDDLLAQGLPALNFGIGLHSGDVVAALVGSSVRKQYGVIGDTINVASRHCTLAGSGQIVVSEVTAALVGGVPDAERVEGIAMKGVDGERAVFRIQAGPTSTSGSPDLIEDES
jgi:adenylate cyclase